MRYGLECRIEIRQRQAEGGLEGGLEGSKCASFFVIWDFDEKRCNFDDFSGNSKIGGIAKIAHFW